MHEKPHVGCSSQEWLASLNQRWTNNVPKGLYKKLGLLERAAAMTWTQFCFILIVSLYEPLLVRVDVTIRSEPFCDCKKKQYRDAQSWQHVLQISNHSTHLKEVKTRLKGYNKTPAEILLKCLFIFTRKKLLNTRTSTSPRPLQKTGTKQKKSQQYPVGKQTASRRKHRGLRLLCHVTALMPIIKGTIDWTLYQNITQ